MTSTKDPSVPHPGRRATVIGFLLVVMAFLFALLVSPHLPHEVPVHWNAANQVNGTMPKPWGVFIQPILMLVVWAILWALPHISPRRFRMEGFRHVYDVLQLVILGFMLVMTVTQLLAAAGLRLPIGMIVTLGIGLLFVVLGNFMGKIRKNFFVGIRTPWTLADDEVWLRTHRFAGWLFVAGGFAFMAEGLLGLSPLWLIVTIALMVLLPIVESYRLYVTISRRRKAGS